MPQVTRWSRVILVILMIALPLVVWTSGGWALSASIAATTVTGRVLLQGRAEHSGAAVQIGAQSATTTADGSFVVADAPAGAQDVTARKAGFLSARGAAVHIAAEQTTVLADVTLLAGDVTEDDRINIFDLVQLAVVYGACPPPDPRLDFTGDNCVNIFDLVLLAGNYGQEGPRPWPTPPGGSATVVPIPTATGTVEPTATSMPVVTGTPATPTVTATSMPIATQEPYPAPTGSPTAVP